MQRSNIHHVGTIWEYSHDNAIGQETFVHNNWKLSYNNSCFSNWLVVVLGAKAIHYWLSGKRQGKVRG